jgi:hypothetical protein
MVQTRSEALFQKNLAITKEYYHNASDEVWSNQDVINIIRNNPSRPREALMGTTINGYEFKYHGLPMPCSIM